VVNRFWLVLTLDKRFGYIHADIGGSIYFNKGFSNKFKKFSRRISSVAKAVFLNVGHQLLTVGNNYVFDDLLVRL
jgi:hypothetical protein